MGGRTPQTINDLIAKIAERAKELADFSMIQLRMTHPENVQHSDWRHVTQGMTRGEIIEVILIDEFSLEFDIELEERNPSPEANLEDHYSFREYLQNKYNVKLWLSTQGGYLILNELVVPSENRREGIGTQVMQELTEYADLHQLPTALTPASIGGDYTPPKILVKFYKKFGFLPNKGRNKDFRISELMIRPVKL